MHFVVVAEVAAGADEAVVRDLVGREVRGSGNLQPSVVLSTPRNHYDFCDLVLPSCPLGSTC